MRHYKEVWKWKFKFFFPLCLGSGREELTKQYIFVYRLDMEIHGTFLYPLKTSENIWFSDIFRGSISGPNIFIFTPQTRICWIDKILCFCIFHLIVDKFVVSIFELKVFLICMLLKSCRIVHVSYFPWPFNVCSCRFV